MSQEEADHRQSLIGEAQSCLREVFDTNDEVLVTITGEVLLVGGAYVEQFMEFDLPEGDVSALEDLSFVTANALPHPCVPEDLYKPTAAALEFNTRETALKRECLDEAGVSYSLVGAEGRLQHVVPGPFPSSDADLSSDADPSREIEHEVWSDCEGSARAEALSDFVAGPALMYTGSAARFDPFFGDGWRRTALAGVAVLGVATGVTVLAGRRLTRPIRALTGAARRMGDGDHGTRVAISGHDEVARLAGAFNSMAESIEANDAQRRAMIGDIAHELRTPLSNVRGYLEAAEDGVVPLDPALVESLLEESSLLQRLIDDLQDLALADAGMLRVHTEARDVVELTRQVVSAHRAGADEAGVRLVADVEPGPAMVNVDPERLRQALGNLVSNAVRFTPDGGLVTVSVRADDSSVVIAVTDNGPGIPREHLPRLFDRFYRVEGSRSRETGGSGLGLSITKHLVEAHQGSVTVESVEGEGSVFTIRLPVHQPVPAERSIQT
jgi:two-component system sensor histidine kinase BaeS